MIPKVELKGKKPSVFFKNIEELKMLVFQEFVKFLFNKKLPKFIIFLKETNIQNFQI